MNTIFFKFQFQVLFLGLSTYVSSQSIIVKDTFFTTANSLNISPCASTITIEAIGLKSEDCEEDGLSWKISLDEWNDFVIDKEYLSSLNPNDDPMDDSDGNGILDIFIAATLSGQKLVLPSFTIDNGKASSHNLVYMITDACGNSNEAKQTFEVLDKQAPSLIGLMADTIVSLSSEHKYMKAVDFDRGSFDDCDADNKLLYTFNGDRPVANKIGMEHFFKGIGEAASITQFESGQAQKWLPSERSSLLSPSRGLVICGDPITLSVWDESYNVVQENIAVQKLITNGIIQYESSTVFHTKTFKEIEFVVSGVTMLASGIESEALNDGHLSYPLCKDVCFTVRMDENDKLKGIDYNDLITIRNHLTGIRPFVSKYQWIAADVNDDGNVNYSDILHLYKYIIGSMDLSQKWIFCVDEMEENNVIQSNGENTFCSPKTLDAASLIGIKIGDVNGSWVN